MTTPSALNNALAERLEESAGEKYQPSSGTEGAIFQSAYCNQCVKDRPARMGQWGDSCPIIANSMVYNTSDPEYPTEWIYGEDGQPTCTAFEKDPAS